MTSSFCFFETQEHILSDQLSSYEASVIQQQTMGGPFVNNGVGGWLVENGSNQAQYYDPSAHSAMYETLLQGSSSSSNQNNMGECHMSNHNGDMFQEWAQAYNSTTAHNPSNLLPPMQHQVLKFFFVEKYILFYQQIKSYFIFKYNSMN